MIRNSTATIFRKKYRIVLLIAFLFGITFSFGQVLTVTSNGNTIVNNDITPSTLDNTDYGTIPKDTKLSKSFIIKNTGAVNLTFASTVVNRVVISGANADQFVINVGVGFAAAPLVLKPNTYVVMEVSFKPTSNGLKNATITVGSNNLSDTTYSFNIQGNASTYAIPTFKRTVLAPILNYPTNLYVGPDDYLWISERAGKKISRISKDGTIVDNILDLSSVIYQTVSQDGLMGIVLHPDLGKGLGSDYVYVAYTYNTSGNTPITGYSNAVLQAEKDFNTANNPFRFLRIVRYNYSVSSNDGTLSSPLTLIEGITGGNDHNSGRLLFGPDNKLYYTVGDHGHNQAGGKCNPVNSQNIPTAGELAAMPPNYTNYQGKSLRLNIDNGNIPADNPTINGIQSHIFTYGHRNASGLTFGKNGLLYSSEHGPNFDDELNILESGNNYGWPHVSGFRDDKNYKYLSLYQYAIDNAISPCSGITTQSTLTEQFGALESSWGGTFTNPISTWGSTIDNNFDSSIGTYSWPTIAPSNIKIYDNSPSFEIPGWNNSIFTTTLKNGRVYRQKLSTDGRSIVGEAEELFETINRYRDLAFDPDGKVIYLITDTAGATSVVIDINNAQPVTDKGKIIVYTYEVAPTPCSVPVADLVTLTALSDPCCIATSTPPTATSNCSSTGGIIGTTATVFPITSSQTITWTYTNGDGSSSTQNQTVTITNPITIWNGSWSNGAPSATKTAIINANITIAADLTACGLIVDNNSNVTVNSAFKVTLAGSLVVKPGSSFTLNNNAALYQTNAAAMNSGNISVKRNSSSLMLYDYTIWSSPVANQTFSLFSPLTTSSRFHNYNTLTNVYNAAIPSINNFETGKGYLIRMPNNHPVTPTIWEGNFIGVPNNGDRTVAITGNGGGFRFNLVGNPYPSPISISSFFADNTVAGDIRINGPIYFWRKTNGVVGTAYCTHTASVYTTNSNAQAVNPGGVIQTGQGFIVEARTNNTSLLFKNSQRVSNTTNQFFKTKEAGKDDISTLWLNATDDFGAFSQMAVTYNSEATYDVDLHDGIYINDSNYALSSLLDNEEYVIQGRPTFDVTDEVPLVFKTPTAGNYKIAIDHTEGLFSGNQDIILKDNLTGTETNLKSSDYTFSANEVVDNSRFTLKYQKTLGSASNDLKENRLLVILKDGRIQIQSDITNLKEVLVHDISGRLFFKKQELNTLGLTIESAKFGNQVLIVTIATQDKKVISKKILN